MSSVGSIMSGAANAEDSITNSIIQGQKMLSEQALTAEKKRQGAWDRKMGEEDFSLKKLLTMQDYNQRQEEIERKKKLRDLLASGRY